MRRPSFGAPAIHPQALTDGPAVDVLHSGSVAWTARGSRVAPTSSDPSRTDDAQTRRCDDGDGQHQHHDSRSSCCGCCARRDPAILPGRMAAPMRPRQRLRVPRLHGFAVRFSPFRADRLCMAAAQYYGLAGAGTLLLVEPSADRDAALAVRARCSAAGPTPAAGIAADGGWCAGFTCRTGCSTAAGASSTRTTRSARPATGRYSCGT